MKAPPSPTKVIPKDDEEGIEVHDIESNDDDYEMPLKDEISTPKRIHKQEKISPVSPTPTMATTPMSLDDSPAFSRGYGSVLQPATLTIEHKNVKSRSGVAAVLFSKPTMMALGGLLLLSTTGSAAYFLTGWLGIPNLKEEVRRLENEVDELEAQVDELEIHVDRLEVQVDRLSNETDRLANETSRLEVINGNLEDTVEDITEQNDRLNASLIEFGRLNFNLNESVVELFVENKKLKDNVDHFSILNQNLSDTVVDLEGNVNRLETSVDDLNDANDGLLVTIQGLTNETSELTTQNQILNTSILTLQGQIVNMSMEIDRLEKLSSNLATVVSFLNETSAQIDGSLDVFTEFLAEQIDWNRVLVLATLENLFRIRASFWDCDFRDNFLTDAFVQDRNLPIGAQFYPDVIAYVEDRILDELCLSPSNFEEYMTTTFSLLSPEEASFNVMLRAVGAYTDLAVEHYFPSTDADTPTVGGVTREQWSNAGFACARLPAEQRYTYSRG